jgi:hypothetical protein
VEVKVLPRQRNHARRPAAPPGQELVEDHPFHVVLGSVDRADPRPACLCAHQYVLRDVLGQVRVAGHHGGVAQQRTEPEGNELVERHGRATFEAD